MPVGHFFKDAKTGWDFEGLIFFLFTSDRFEKVFTVIQIYTREKLCSIGSLPQEGIPK